MDLLYSCIPCRNRIEESYAVMAAISRTNGLKEVPAGLREGLAGVARASEATSNYGVLQLFQQVLTHLDRSQCGLGPGPR